MYLASYRLTSLIVFGGTGLRGKGSMFVTPFPGPDAFSAHTTVLPLNVKRSFWVQPNLGFCVPGELGMLCDASLFLSAPSTFQVDPFVPPDAPAVVVCSFLERTVHLSGAVFCFSMVMLMLCCSQLRDSEYRELTLRPALVSG